MATGPSARVAGRSRADQRRPRRDDPLSPLDCGPLDDAAFKRYERVQALLDWSPHERNRARTPVAPGAPQGSPWEPRYVRAAPLSRLGGFSSCETNPERVEILESELPLLDGDRHVLLADINPGQFTDAAWFHGGRHLEVWIRASAMQSRQLDDVWCFIRTDC